MKASHRRVVQYSWHSCNATLSPPAAALLVAVAMAQTLAPGEKEGCPKRLPSYTKGIITGRYCGENRADSSKNGATSARRSSWLASSPLLDSPLSSHGFARLEYASPPGSAFSAASGSDHGHERWNMAEHADGVLCSSEEDGGDEEWECETWLLKLPSAPVWWERLEQPRAALQSEHITGTICPCGLHCMHLQRDCRGCIPVCPHSYSRPHAIYHPIMYRL